MRLLTLMLLAGCSAFAQNVYVSTTGSDSNNGTSLALAVQTPEKARQLSRNFNGACTGTLTHPVPVVVQFEPGTYYANVYGPIPIVSASEGGSGSTVTVTVASSAIPSITTAGVGITLLGVNSGGVQHYNGNWTVATTNGNNSLTFADDVESGFGSIAGGFLYIGPVTLTASDSGFSANCPVIYRANPNNPGAAISGGIRVTGWTNTGSGCSGTCTVWTAPLPAGAGEPYFESLWYNGQRRFKPRLGATAGNDIGTYGRSLNGGLHAYVAPTDACSLNGGTSGCNGSTNSTCITDPGNASFCWDRLRVTSTTGLTNSLLNLSVPADSFLNPQNDILLSYIELFSWPIMRITAVDTVNNILIFNCPSSPAGCWKSVTAVPGSLGPVDNHRFIVENVKDLFTLPQQFYLDRTASGGPANWVLKYNAAPGENPNTDTVEVPFLPLTMAMYGVSNVHFYGLGFKHGNYTITPQGFIDTQGEPLVTAMVSVQNPAGNVQFIGDTFANADGDGIEIKPCRTQAIDISNCLQFPGAGGATWDTTGYGVTVEHSTIYDLGDHGIQIGNRNGSNAGDTNANVAQNVSVIDNLVQGWSRRFPGSFGLFFGNGHDMFFVNNDFLDGYHSAISGCVPPCPYGSASSNGVYNVNSFFNRIDQIMEGVSSDGGALYYATQDGTSNRIWNNFVTNVNDPTAQAGESSDANGGHCLYLDRQTGLVDVGFNVVIRCSSVAMWMTRGITLTSGPNNIHSNLLTYGRLSMISGGGGGSSWFQAGDCQTSARLMFISNGNLEFFDRYGTSSGQFFVNKGTAYSCSSGTPSTANTYPFIQFEKFVSNFYYRDTCPDGNCTAASFNTDPCAFHVQSSASAVSNVQGPTGNSLNSTPNWTFLTPSQWTSGAATGTTWNGSTCGGSNTPFVPSTGEDVGAVTNTAPPFVNGLPSANTVPCAVGGASCWPYNYANFQLLTNNATLNATGFSAVQTNSTLTNAGRFANNKGIFKTVVTTFPTAVYDPTQTDDGSF